MMTKHSKIKIIIFSVLIISALLTIVLMGYMNSWKQQKIDRLTILKNDLILKFVESNSKYRAFIEIFPDAELIKSEDFVFFYHWTEEQEGFASYYCKVTPIYLKGDLNVSVETTKKLIPVKRGSTNEINMELSLTDLQRLKKVR